MVRRTRPVANPGILGWLEANGIILKKKEVIVFKKVSKDFLTQENTERQTGWEIGATVEHPAWDPSKEECGAGKFHACSRPYFCDEFRDEPGDRYIAISVSSKDLFAWQNPSYPHKIGFRKGKVLHECDRYGEKITTSKGERAGKDCQAVIRWRSRMPTEKVLTPETRGLKILRVLQNYENWCRHASFSERVDIGRKCVADIEKIFSGEAVNEAADAR